MGSNKKTKLTHPTHECVLLRATKQCLELPSLCLPNMLTKLDPWSIKIRIVYVCNYKVHEI